MNTTPRYHRTEIAMVVWTTSHVDDEYMLDLLARDYRCGGLVDAPLAAIEISRQTEELDAGTAAVLMVADAAACADQRHAEPTECTDLAGLFGLPDVR